MRVGVFQGQIDATILAAIFCKDVWQPAIVGGSIFSFIQSFENLEMTLFLVGPGTTTLPIAMMNYLEFRADPTVAAVATIQIIIVAVALLVTDRFVNIARVMK